MNNKKIISIGIPCFNEELNVLEAYKTIKLVTQTIKSYNFEYIFVDNGSSDNTKKIIKKIVLQDKNVIGIFLSRNFGPEASAQAIIDQTDSDALICLSCDLQDPPELIPEFIKKWEQKCDVVLGVYTKTEDNIFMSFARKIYYRFLKSITYIEIPTNATGFGLLDRKVINAIRSLPEKYRFFRGLLAWVGFKKAYIKYERRQRRFGKSSYNFLDYIKHAERSFFGFSYLSLNIIIYLGLFLVFLSFVFIFLYIFVAIIYGNPIKGSITIFVSIVFFGGIQLLAISIIGKYIQVIIEETKSRPVYIIDEIINNKK